MGVMSRSDVIEALMRDGPDVLVGSVMERRFVTARPDEFVESALARIPPTASRDVPVVRHGVVVGLLTPESLGEVVFLDRALHAHVPRFIDRATEQRPTANAA